MQIEHNGRTFTVTIEADSDMPPPWENEDGHGIVSGWRKGSWYGYPSKRQGERPLVTDHGYTRFYDFAEAVKTAKRDGWGASKHDRDAWARKGITPTRGMVAVSAAEADFRYLQRWCNADWYYVYVTVTDDETGESASLGGVESDYAETHVYELVKELASCFAEKD